MSIKDVGAFAFFFSSPPFYFPFRVFIYSNLSFLFILVLSVPLNFFYVSFSPVLFNSVIYERWEEGIGKKR